VIVKHSRLSPTEQLSLCVRTVRVHFTPYSFFCQLPTSLLPTIQYTP